MAWEPVTYSCGCVGHEQMYGKTVSRKAKADWISKNRLCSDCYEKQLQEKRDSELAKAQEKANKLSLPELEGTERQIAWATSIRVDLVEKNLEILGSLTDEKIKEFAKERLQNFTSETKAHFWIDNRNIIAKTPDEVIELYEKHMAKLAGLEILKA